MDLSIPVPSRSFFLLVLKGRRDERRETRDERQKDGETPPGAVIGAKNKFWRQNIQRKCNERGWAVANHRIASHLSPLGSGLGGLVL